MLTPEDASLMGAFAQAVLFGLYLNVACTCTRLLWRRHKERRTHHHLVITHVILFCLITFRCFTVIVRSIYERWHIKSAVIVLDLGSSWGLAANVPWVLTILVSDTFLIYRIVVVWQRYFWAVIFPVLLLLADAGSGVYFIVSLTSYTEDQSVFAQNLGTSTRMFCSFTAALNILCTGLLAYRIVDVQRRVAFEDAHLKKGMSNIMALVVESASLWTAISVCIIVTISIQNYLEFLFMDVSCPTIGLVFGSIIIRVSSGSSHGDDDKEESRPIQFDGSGASSNSMSGARHEPATITLNKFPTDTDATLTSSGYPPVVHRKLEAIV
ncbi:hypothetical protein CYLTODRAFT_379537 [Cylindrobasidium torrendii FP15055 ss-10]|uniref:G-protein coupled receptors family 1 profile domain-containing protein n=1 Tax=Cylindrobasidium torrendii FP15055 ss-10 TaxID=1314674 RepID=A0A0D7B567_9AGAR|nr:hypothetical protein CYLTODRAFT_379537 [Cylindrobasidium torrendii FP15055 ss-10]